MSYSHTKRRKLIAKLKKKHCSDWQKHFNHFREETIRKMDGPPIGTLEDLINFKSLSIEVT